MKLVCYDEKQQSIGGQLELGETSLEDELLIQKVLVFLKEEGFLGGYNKLKLCKNATYVYRDNNDKEQIDQLIKFS